MYISTVTLKYFLWITEVYSRLPEVAVWSAERVPLINVIFIIKHL